MPIKTRLDRESKYSQSVSGFLSSNRNTLKSPSYNIYHCKLDLESNLHHLDEEGYMISFQEICWVVMFIEG